MIRVLKLPSIIATLGTSASSKVPRSSSEITPKAPSRATSSAVSRRASASFPSPSLPWWPLPCSPTCGCTARVRASPRERSASTSVVAPARDGDRAHRRSRLRHLLGDGVARRLLPCGPGTDRVAAHRQLGLESIAAAVLGGAALSGGKRLVRRRSPRGALPLADRQHPAVVPPADEYSQITIGLLILLALVLYQSPELLGRLRTSRGGVGRLQASEGDAPAG